MKNLGLILISSLIKEGSTETYLALNLSEELFTKSEVELYEFIDHHVSKFGVVPAQETFQEFADQYSLKLVDTKEPPAYYHSEIIDRYVTTSMKRVVTEAKTALMSEEPTEVLNKLITDAVDISVVSYGSDIVDFRDVGSILEDDYYAKLTNPDEFGIMMGWPYIDDMTYGLQPGDMVSIIGRPGQGKTFQLLYNAHYAWIHQKKKVMVVSMEMIPLAVMQRLAAMQAKYSLTHIKSGSLTTKAFPKVFGALYACKDHPSPFYIVDGNLTATIEDIWRLAMQLKPDAIYIDGAYLVKVSKGRGMNKWDRIGYVAEEIKSKIATNLKIPAIATYQFGKDMVKKKKKIEDIGLEDIYGSDVIGQVSSIVMGLFEDDSVETLLRRRINLLKGRGGEVGFFYTLWDFYNMDFSQYEEPKNAQLQHE